MKTRNNQLFQRALIGILLITAAFFNHGDAVAQTSDHDLKSTQGTTCPTLTNEVRLYSLPNCGGNYVYVTSPGLYSLGNFDNSAASIAISNGWSAKLYKDASEWSPSAYFAATDPDLGDNHFFDDSTVKYQASFLHVYDNASFALSDDDATIVTLEVPPYLGQSQSFTVTLTLKNTGTTTWEPATYRLRNIINPVGANTTQLLTSDVPPNGTYTWIIPMQSNMMVGSLYSRWIMTHNGVPFEDMASILIGVTFLPPNTPNDLRVTGSTSNSISLAWWKIYYADGIKIYKWQYLNNIWDYYYYDSVNYDVTNFTDTSLQCGLVDYSYKISSYNVFGESSLTDPVTGTTTECIELLHWIYLPLLIK